MIIIINVLFNVNTHYIRLAIQQRRVMGRGRDVFRTRARNTSRPPSMHVDDFMNMGSRVSTNLTY